MNGRSVGIGRVAVGCERPTQRLRCGGREGDAGRPVLLVLALVLGCLREDFAPTEPVPVIGTRETPALVSQTVRVRTAEGVLRLTLMRVESGAQAANMIRNASPDNLPPPAGREYVIARFRVQVDSLFSSRPIVVAHGRFVAVSENGVIYPSVTLAGITPSLSAEMYAGSFEGWTWFQALISDRGTLAVFDGREVWQTWFALR